MDVDLQPRLSFFGTLGRLATRQEENQLSRTFEACFNASEGFRREVIDLLARTCKCKVKNDSTWRAHAELGAGDGGRLDVRIRSDAPGGPVFELESKVGSKLTLKQLLRYKAAARNDQTHLIAVTRNHPEVAAAALRRHRIRAIRWQDVHRRVTDRPGTRPVDRFIAREFARYLEESGMAHRQRLRRADLDHAHRLLRVMRNESWAEVKAGFEVLDGLTEMLRDIHRELRDDLNRPGNLRGLGV